MPVFTRARLRAAAGVVLTVVAALTVWFALVAPNKVSLLSVGAFLRIPLEAVIVGCVAVVLPPRPRQAFAIAIGALLGLLPVLKLLDIGFYDALDPPVDPATDPAFLGPAIGLLQDSSGHSTAVVLGTVAAGAAVAIPVATALAAMRLTRLASLHRTETISGLTAVGVVWALLAVVGAPLASTSAADLAYDQVV